MGDDVTATGNIVEGSSVGAAAGAPPGVPGGGGGGFRIPKVASSQAPGAGGGSAADPAPGAPAPHPPSEPSHPPAFTPGAPRDDRYDRGLSGATATAAAADDEDRKRRVHKGTRRHRHMLVLDLNGLLVDRRMSPFENPVDGTKVAPDAKFGKFYIYNRPHMQSFVEWASEHFTVGVWSSAQHHNARTLVNHIWGKRRDRLAFVWGQDRCTHVGAMDPAAGPGPGSKPILLKDLRALWAVSSHARFGPNNTLLLDDSPYKAVMNPAHTAIHPAEYKLSWGEESAESPNRRMADELLGPNGALRTYLAKLSERETVTAYVAANPWRHFGPAAPDSDPGLMAKAREGGEAVAAAAAATAIAGVDANEIDLGEFSDDEEREEAKGEVEGSRPRRVETLTLTLNPNPIDPDGWGGSGDEAEGDARSNGGVGTKREAPESGTNAAPASRKQGKKPRRVFTGSGASLFIRRWAWKREAKTDEERFVLPYEHEWLGTKMSFAQRRFDDGGGFAGGFASTVWDSSIVLAKYVEKRRGSFANKKVCELGAGCGVVSAALVKAGCARVVATDLPENLPLLRENMERNCGGGENGQGGEGTRWEVKALTWGADAAVALGETFDVVVAADCMYIAEAASDLVDTLAALVPAGGESPGLGSLPPALMSYGRNRQAEDEFLAACDGAKSGKARTLTIEDVAESELDELYQCSDVRVVNVAMR